MNLAAMLMGSNDAGVRPQFNFRHLMKILIVIVAAAGAFLLTRSRCSSAESSGKKPITVGFSQIGAESGWRTAETKSIRSEAAKRGVNLKFSDAQQKQENQ